MSTQRFFCEGLEDFVVIDDDQSVVMAGQGCSIKGEIRCHLKDTGNGYIAHFPSYSSTNQDNYICMDYDQAQTLVMALSAFKKELGLNEKAQLIPTKGNQAGRSGLCAVKHQTTVSS